MTRRDALEALVARADHLGIVTLIGDAAFAAWTPVAAIPTHLSSVEELLARDGRPLPRTREEQAALRVALCARLRDAGRAQAAYSSWIASTVLWLGWNHWARGETLRSGIEALVAGKGRAVLTASVAVPAPADALPDTAWAFMAGLGVHDGRDELGRTPAGVVRVTRSSDGTKNTEGRT